MRPWSSLPRHFLATVAVLFAATATLYGCLWMYEERPRNSQVELGFNYQGNDQYDEKTHSLFVNDVVKDSPAERAGLRAGDRIIGVNGRMLITSAPYDQAYARGRPGDSVEFVIARPDKPGPLILHGIFRAKKVVGLLPFQAQEGLARSSAQQAPLVVPRVFSSGWIRGPVLKDE